VEICFLYVLNFHATLVSKWMYSGSGRSAQSSYIPHVWHIFITLVLVKNHSETLKVAFDQAGSDDFLSLKTARHRQGLKLHHACSFSEGKYFSFPS
jgi:hypothetical protein